MKIFDHFGISLTLPCFLLQGFLEISRTVRAWVPASILSVSILISSKGCDIRFMVIQWDFMGSIPLGYNYLMRISYSWRYFHGINTSGIDMDLSTFTDWNNLKISERIWNIWSCVNIVYAGICWVGFPRSIWAAVLTFHWKCLGINLKQQLESWENIGIAFLCMIKVWIHPSKEFG